MFSKFTFSVIVLVALVVSLNVEWIQAQKTSKNSFQQQISTGSGPNAVYGGYQTSSGSRQTSFTSPVNRRTQQTYVSRTQQSVQPVYQQQQQVSASSSYEQSEQQAEADAEPAQYGAVAGQPGKDFPAYTQVPKTSFSCEGLPYDYGMYADEETGCQAYHVCYNGRKDSFLCGVGTVFNQRVLHCDYWYSVECGKSSQYWGSNAYMGSSQPEPGPAQAQTSFKRTQSSSTSIVRRPVLQQQPQQTNYQESQSQYNSIQQQQQPDESY